MDPSMMKPKARYVYLQTAMHLWRFDLEGIDDAFCTGRYSGPGDMDNKGVLTKLFDFRDEGTVVPLGAGGFVLGSKLFFVGGETVTRLNKWVPDQDALFPFDDVSEVNTIHEEEGPNPYASGYLQLPISCLNRRVFMLDNFYKGHNHEPTVPSVECSIAGSSFESESLGPKTDPLVVPIRSGDKTMVYVIARERLYYDFSSWIPSFEVFDPSLNSWEALQEPPYLYPYGTHFPGQLAFEFRGKIVLISSAGTEFDELTFDPETKRWQRTCLFQMFGGNINCRRLIHVDGLGDDTLFGCHFHTFLACKVGTKGQIDSLILDKFSPYWPTTNFDKNTTVCDLGNGFVLYTSVTIDQDLKHLHFYFVTLRVSNVNPRKRPLGSGDDSIPFVSDSIPFVSAETKQFCHRVVRCDYHNLMRHTDVYNAYVL